MKARLVTLLGFTCLFALVGAVIGPGFWWWSMVRDGRDILAALHGQVEDGLPLLYGLALLGAMVGTVIGFFVGVSEL